MINRIVCRGILISDWEEHKGEWGKLIVSRIVIADAKRDKSRSVFINVKAFKKTAELLLQYTHKGSKLFIDGRLDMQEYDNGSYKKYTYSIVIDKVEWEYEQLNDNEKGGKNEKDIPF